MAQAAELADRGSKELQAGNGKSLKYVEAALQVEGHPFVMDIDTGAAVSIISENTFKQ